MKMSELKKYSIDKVPLRYCIWGIGVLQKISYPFTLLFLKLDITANQITWLSLIAGFAGGWCFLYKDYFLNILGVFLLNLWGILDCSDGVVARIMNISSEYGAKLEAFVGTFVVCALPLFIGHGNMLGAIVMCLFFIIRCFFTHGKPSVTKFFKKTNTFLLIGYNLMNATGVVGVLIPFVLFNRLDLFLWMYLVLSILNIGSLVFIFGKNSSD